MTPQLAEAIDAARALVRLGHSNKGTVRVYREFTDAAETFVSAARALGTRSTEDVLADVSEGPQVTALVAQIGRLSRCYFSNRRGPAYWDRKQAMAEMRGCLIAFDST